MKKSIIILLLTLFGWAGSGMVNKAEAAPQVGVSVSFQVFYDQLSPYGSWVSSPAYGYVWVPRMASFTPYCTGGHWEYTYDGWIWVSDYDWGWAPFHYGRWSYDNMYGWMWVPGYDWAPAWVVWGSYNNYYGWAPLGPGVVYTAGYRPPAHYWNFVPQQNITQVNIVNYRVQNTTVINNNVQNITVINNSKSYSNKQYFSGPAPTDVEKRTGRKINAVAINESARPAATRVSNNRVEIYRPAVNREAKAAPTKVEKMENLTPINRGKANPPAANKPATNNATDINRNTGRPQERNAPQPAPGGEKRQLQQQPNRGAVTPENKMPQRREPLQQQPAQRSTPQQRSMPENKAMPQERNMQRQQPATPQQPNRQAEPRVEKREPMPSQQPMQPRENRPMQQREPVRQQPPQQMQRENRPVERMQPPQQQRQQPMQQQQQQRPMSPPLRETRPMNRPSGQPMNRPH